MKKLLFIMLAGLMLVSCNTKKYDNEKFTYDKESKILTLHNVQNGAGIAKDVNFKLIYHQNVEPVMYQFIKENDVMFEKGCDSVLVILDEMCRYVIKQTKNDCKYVSSFDFNSESQNDISVTDTMLFFDFYFTCKNGFGVVNDVKNDATIRIDNENDGKLKYWPNWR